MTFIQHTKMASRKQLLPFLATVLVVLGALAVFYPQNLQRFLPAPLTTYLLEHYWLAMIVFVTALVLHV
jgi:hypothetical protein